MLLCAASPLFTGALKAQSVTISPGYTNIGINQTLQYTAAVTGLANTSVTWSVGGVVGGNAKNGTITKGGLYTAPGTPVGPTVSALASDGKTMGIVYVNVEAAGPSIAGVSPSPVPTGTSTITLTGAGFVKGAMAMVNGATTRVTYVNATTLTLSVWQGTPGSVPIQIQNPGTLWGTVFKVPFAASGPPPQTISPTTATVNLSAQQQFTSANATVWSATAGTIVGGLYTAPAAMPTPSTPTSSKITVTATGPGGSASATVTLVNPNAQQISPTSVSLNLGAQQQFTSAGATAWTAAAGSITTAGLYNPPSAMTSSGTDTVTATGPNGTATATVTLIPPAPVISSAGNGGQLALTRATSRISSAVRPGCARGARSDRSSDPEAECRNVDIVLDRDGSGRGV